MKIFSIVFTIIALVLIGYNLTKINRDALFSKESTLALITILASVCAILLVHILRISKRIQRKHKFKN